MRNLFQKILSGQLPFFARIISQSGEATSMEVNNVSITEGGKTTILLDEKMTLATNSTHGDKTATSVALISIPTDGLSPGAIRTFGNAAVTNVTRHQKIALAGGVKKLKAISKSGLFVVARTGLQRDTQIEYFDFLFGMLGQSESVDESGEKQRPHIALYPNGSGKFIRLSKHNCEIEGNMQYVAGEHQILPQQLRIKSIDSGETIEAMFSAENTEQIVLKSICFTTERYYASDAQSNIKQ
jgi:hypothetical protein